MTYIFSFSLLIISFSLFSQTPGLNFYAEKGYTYNLGVGIRYGNMFEKIIVKSTRFEKTIKGANFRGLIAKFNHSINTSWNQIELWYVRTMLFSWGIGLSNVNYLNKHSFGLKPLIGLSIDNFSLFYTY